MAKTPIESNLSTTGIPGLAPVDVYLNFEKLGFSIKKDLQGGDLGNIWDCSLNKGGRDFKVVIYGNDISSVSEVKATLVRDSNQNGGDDVQFFKYVVSLPYSGADPQRAAGWIEQNFDMDGAQTTIAGVTFKLFAPTDYSRILIIK